MLYRKVSGSFNATYKFLDKLANGDIYKHLDSYAQAGVRALASATPKESGLTANSWSYVIEANPRKYKITWINTNVSSGVNIAIILQYGHGTGTGGYVSGIDYINPAIKPIFDRIADQVKTEVRAL